MGIDREILISEVKTTNGNFSERGKNDLFSKGTRLPLWFYHTTSTRFDNDKQLTTKIMSSDQKHINQGLNGNDLIFPQNPTTRHSHVVNDWPSGTVIVRRLTATTCQLRELLNWSCNLPIL